MDSPSSPLPHIALFPFTSKSHTILLVHLVNHLHRHGRVTYIAFFTISLNAPFIRSSLSSATAESTTVISLPFSKDLPQEFPAGVESIDHLPSIDLFMPFVTSISRMRPAFSQAIRRLSPLPSLLICDGFLSWAQGVAVELNIPRLVFYGMGGFAQTVLGVVYMQKPHAEVSSHDEPFSVPSFPHLSLRKDDIEPPFDDLNPKGPRVDFLLEQIIACNGSRGFIMNSFYEFESPYFDYMESKMGLTTYKVLHNGKAIRKTCHRHLSF